MTQKEERPRERESSNIKTPTREQIILLHIICIRAHTHARTHAHTNTHTVVDSTFDILICITLWSEEGPGSLLHLRTFITATANYSWLYLNVYPDHVCVCAVCLCLHVPWWWWCCCWRGWGHVGRINLLPAMLSIFLPYTYTVHLYVDYSLSISESVFFKLKINC